MVGPLGSLWERAYRGIAAASEEEVERRDL
jgi:hypothetical protein